jgi:hypothetical protein
LQIERELGWQKQDEEERTHHHGKRRHFGDSCLAQRGDAEIDKAFQKLRVKRLAAPMLMIAAGTRAPIAIAAKANPANHPGNKILKRSGTTSLLFESFRPAAWPI